MSSTALQTATLKVRRHLLPFLMISYFACYLDRVNVGFASLTMNGDLGIGKEAYGFTAGIFFLGYCLFEVPSNIMLQRVGARIWIARIMISWALVSAAMAFVWDVTSLSAGRFLLGIAEAGFFPGIIYYLTRWVPVRERASVIATFMSAIPVSNMIGAPVSGAILDAFDGVLGFKGWQWLFVIEAIPSLVLGFMAFKVLKNAPEDAEWLNREEASALSHEIAAEDATQQKGRATTLSAAFSDVRMLSLAAAYFGIIACMYGMIFWIPHVVKGFGLSNTATGVASAIPYLAAAVAMYGWGRLSDRKAERLWMSALPCIFSGVALIAGIAAPSPVFALAAFSAAAIGIFCGVSLFWMLPPAFLTTGTSAAGIAFVNAIGSVGGFLGPYLVGAMQERGYTPSLSIASLAFFAIAAGVLLISLRHDPRLGAATA